MIWYPAAMLVTIFVLLLHSARGAAGMAALPIADCSWLPSKPWQPQSALCTRLRATQAAKVKPPELAVALANLPHLRELHLSSLQLGDVRMEEIARVFSSGALPDLEKLYLAHNNLGKILQFAIGKRETELMLEGGGSSGSEPPKALELYASDSDDKL
mmetsp:Transcript_38533/g.89172  ORF Transcript_38533/g.89172 Transcript_38533/m.89172 type:complete len:158 (+) Transcript_38533:129-602(+)